MPTVVVCHAVPLASDRQAKEGCDGLPDHSLVFWNEHCVADVIARLRDSGVDVRHCEKPDISVADALGALGGIDKLGAVVFFGHGERPHGTPRIWNRRNAPRDVLVDEGLVRAAASAGQVFLACFSLVHFENAAALSSVPVVVGFTDAALTPSVCGALQDSFPDAAQRDLVDRYRVVFVDLVVSLALSAARGMGDWAAVAREWSLHVEQCRRELEAASMQYLRLFHETSNPNFFS